ncbi:hypothetical protein VXS03_13650 [Photobacterium sp. S4TG1]|uniref:hypothetical protein n=1 Tax=Photobacterium sp. S4TG1 TaxID=3114587 RepID=UPI002E17E75E|nr:hypothetical protein [Photobacterium sp. S4TG1]
MKKRRVIAVGVLIIAGLIGVRDLYMTLEPQHVVNVNGKTLHLGQVYSQHLLSTVVITSNEETLLTVTAPITTFVKQLITELNNDVNEANKTLSAGEKMQLSTAYFDTNITFHLSTVVTYNTQHYASISMPLAAITVNYTANDVVQFNDIIELVQRYQKSTQNIFNNNYDFIN